MRTINVSVDVFSKIWASREAGEDNEDDILRRLLGCPQREATEDIAGEDEPLGFYDARNGIYFNEGFGIVRTYKGTKYGAVATRGRWHLINSNRYFSSLNQLSKAVSDGNENAWVSWNYFEDGGEERKLTRYREKYLQASEAGLLHKDINRPQDIERLKQALKPAGTNTGKEQ
jgi:hypothetical protein